MRPPGACTPEGHEACEAGASERKSRCQRTQRQRYLVVPLHAHEKYRPAFGVPSLPRSTRNPVALIANSAGADQPGMGMTQWGIDVFLAALSLIVQADDPLHTRSHLVTPNPSVPALSTGSCQVPLPGAPAPPACSTSCHAAPLPSSYPPVTVSPILPLSMLPTHPQS